MSSPQSSASFLFLCLSYGPLPIYGPLSLHDTLPPPQPFFPFAALCSLFGPMSLLRPSALPLQPLHHSGPLPLSTALCPLYGTSHSLSSLWASVPFMALCGTLSPLRSSVTSRALGPLHGPLSPLRSSVPSSTLHLLHGPEPPLRPSAPSKALYPLQGPLYLYDPLNVSRDDDVSQNSETSEMTLMFREIAKTCFAKPFCQNPSYVTD